MNKYLKLAAEMAVPRQPAGDHRTFWIGAIGIRGDGTLVSARNGSVHAEIQGQRWSFPPAHAEARCSRKMDYDGVVYVARVARNGSLAMARPCRNCVMAMVSRRVKKVYYTVNDQEFGVLELSTSIERRKKGPQLWKGG